MRQALLLTGAVAIAAAAFGTGIALRNSAAAVSYGNYDIAATGTEVAWVLDNTAGTVRRCVAATGNAAPTCSPWSR